jgi:hypothetical protein
LSDATTPVDTGEDNHVPFFANRPVLHASWPTLVEFSPEFADFQALHLTRPMSPVSRMRERLENTELTFEHHHHLVLVYTGRNARHGWSDRTDVDSGEITSKSCANSQRISSGGVQSDRLKSVRTHLPSPRSESGYVRSKASTWIRSYLQPSRTACLPDHE